MRITTAAAIAALAIVGCATATPARPAAERAMTNDGDWYREALEEAMFDYERAVFTGTQTYDPRCFDDLLRTALADRGLTPRGLDTYAEHHPDLAAHLAALRPRLDRIRRNDPAIVTCTLAGGAPQAATLYRAHVRGDL